MARRAWMAGLAARLRLAALLLLVALALPGAPAAQVFDLRQLFEAGGGGEDASGQRQPLQSLPEREFRSSDGPSAEDYARLAEQTRAEGDIEMLGAADTYVRVFRARLVAILERVPGAIDEIGTTLAAASPTGRPIYFLGVAIFAALLLVVGGAVAALYANFIARPIFVRMQRPDPQGFVGKLPVLAMRVVLGVVGIALVLAVAALVGLVFYEEHKATLLTVLVVFGSYASLTLIHTIWRMVLAPYLPEYRLPALSGPEARRLYTWLTGASAVAIAGAAFCYWTVALGLPREVHVLVTLALTFVTVAALIAALRVNREAVTRIVLAGRPRAEASWLSRSAAALWAPLVTLYLLATWGDLAFRLVMGVEAGPGRVLVPFLILIGGILVYGAIMYLVERVFARQRRLAEMNRAAEARRLAEERASVEAIRDLSAAGDAGDMDGDGDEEGAGAGAMAREEPAAREEFRPAGQMRTMEDLARRVASFVAVGVAAYALLRYWGGAALFEESAFFGIAEDLIDVLLVGYVVFHAVRIWLDQKIAEEVGDEEPLAIAEGEGGGAGATRLATLLPLVRNTMLAIIAVTVALLVAMELGVNVAPLFAGAGIVGLAIGFGAQTLVRDIISGAFFLIDDAFRKGEYIDVGDVKGTVEKISIRSFQLRHHLGMLHTIPFGEITHLTNFSRDWVMMKLPLRLTYDTDVEQVRKLIKKLGQSLLEDETVGDKFLQPLKSQGVIQMEDSAMIVRVKFMTRPGDQWVVRKRVYQEIRDLFAREGIHFAHREVTVRIPDLPAEGEIGEENRRAIGAAARTAVDVAEAEEMRRGTGTLGPVDDR